MKKYLFTALLCLMSIAVNAETITWVYSHKTITNDRNESEICTMPDGGMYRIMFDEDCDMLTIEDETHISIMALKCIGKVGSPTDIRRLHNDTYGFAMVYKLDMEMVQPFPYKHLGHLPSTIVRVYRTSKDGALRHCNWVINYDNGAYITFNLHTY